MVKEFDRLKALDTFRGISIFYMIIAHTSEYWLTGGDYWFHCLLFLVFDVIGASSFIFLSGIGLSFSYQMNKKRKKDSLDISINFGMRTLWLFILAVIINLCTTAFIEGITFWLWHVLLTIALARIVCFPLQKASPHIRATIGLFFFLLADIVENFILSTVNPVLYYIFFNGNNLNTPFPFFGFFFIGSAIGDWLYQSSYGKESNSGLIDTLFIKFLCLTGLMMMTLGIIGGYNYSSDSNTTGLLNIIGMQEYFTIAGIHGFLIRNSLSWCFYSIGIEMLGLSFFLFLDNRRMNKEIRQGSLYFVKNQYRVKGFSLLGQYSLTIYVCHTFIYLFFIDSFSIIQYLMAVPITMAIIYSITWLWVHKAKARFTFEWGIRESIVYINGKRNNMDKYRPFKILEATFWECCHFFQNFYKTYNH